MNGREIDKKRTFRLNLVAAGRIVQHSKLHSSTQNAQIAPDVIRHSTETEELLRSAVDLIHYDCYTNGINKGKTAILKHIIFILLVWITLLPRSSSYTRAWAYPSVSVPPPRHGYKVISVAGSVCSVVGFAWFKNNSISFDI